MQKDDRSFRCILREAAPYVSIRRKFTPRRIHATHFKVLSQALEVKGDILLVVVSVLGDFEARVLENRRVVSPRRSRQEDLLGTGVEALQERATDTEGTGSRDGLGDGNAALGQRSRVGSVGELCGVGGESWESSDGLAQRVRQQKHHMGQQNPALTRYSLSLF
jgi:hypothetical protein